MATQQGVTDSVNGAHAQAKIRVVIIDHPNLLRDGIANLLNTQHDIEVVACTDSVIASIEAIRKQRPDVVLLGWPASSPNSSKIFASIQDSKPRVIMLVDEESKE